jgi:hypothetical protein
MSLTSRISSGGRFSRVTAGIHPAGIRINHAERDGQCDRAATFLIRGEGLIRLDREYRSGKALVNPLQFRESLNHLRDILFKTLSHYLSSTFMGRKAAA